MTLNDQGNGCDFCLDEVALRFALDEEDVGAPGRSYELQILANGYLAMDTRTRYNGDDSYFETGDNWQETNDLLICLVQITTAIEVS